MHEKKINCAGAIGISPYFRYKDICEITAIDGGLRIQAYSGNPKKVHFLADVDMQYTLHLPAEALRIAGLERGDKVICQPCKTAVYVFKKFSAIDPADFNKVPYNNPNMLAIPSLEDFHAEAKEAKQWRRPFKGRSLCLSEPLLQLAGIKKGATMTIIKQGQRTWLEVRPYSALAESALTERRYAIPMQDELNGISFANVLSHLPHVGLPLLFCKQFTGYNTRSLPVWYSQVRGALIIEGPSSICDICGTLIRTTDFEPHRVMKACPSCAEELGHHNSIHGLVASEHAVACAEKLKKTAEKK